MTRTYWQDRTTDEWHSDSCEGDERQGGGGCARNCPTRAAMNGYPIRCDLLGCCDEGHYHFDTLDQLRDWLTDDYREDGIPIDCPEPWPLGGAWKDAADAEGWLDAWDRENEAQAARDWIWERAAQRAGVKL